MKKIVLILFAYAVAMVSAFAQKEMPSVEVLNKAVSAVSGAKGMSAEFKVYNSGYSGSGSLKAKGNSFNVIMPDVEVWYNGKDLYTLNKNTEEVTIVTPSAQELTESNPLAYITGATRTYNVKYSTVKKQGRYVLELTPKSNVGEIKRITLTLRKDNFYPEKLVVEPKRGNPVTADITDFKTGVTLSDADFQYPMKKYPKVEVIDLR